MTDQRNSGLGAHLSTELAITADEAVRRLSARILAMSKRTGSFDRRFIGHFADRRFTIRVASWLPSPYFPRAVGEVRDGASGARLEVRFQQDPLGRALRWFEAILAAIIVAGTFAAALRQPVFLGFGAVVAIGAAALIWGQRPRSKDIDALRALILDATAGRGREQGTGPPG